MFIVLCAIVCLLIGYLLGSISNGVWIGKVFAGIDIRNVGSHNAGGTNTGRVLGKKFGLLTIVLDVLKTVVAMWFVLFIIRGVDLINQNVCVSINNFAFTPSFYAYIAGIGAVIGHTYPLYFGFKGGKAVACFAGILIATNWLLTLIGFVTFMLIVIITKYVSLGSILATCLCAALSFIPFFERTACFNFENTYFLYSYLLILLVIYIIFRHRSNVLRLIKGEENKSYLFKKKKVEDK